MHIEAAQQLAPCPENSRTVQSELHRTMGTLSCELGQELLELRSSIEGIASPRHRGNNVLASHLSRLWWHCPRFGRLYNIFVLLFDV